MKKQRSRVGTIRTEGGIRNIGGCLPEYVRAVSVEEMVQRSD